MYLKRIWKWAKGNDTPTKVKNGLKEILAFPEEKRNWVFKTENNTLDITKRY
jgi:hypothetical protein